MSRKRPHARNPVDHAEDVLARRLRVDAGELLELIHAINPTGRQLNEREEARRYELKAHLQSLLVRMFGDELSVKLDADGAIAITHRYLGRDACHAQLDALDEDARAWVRWQLDVADDGARTQASGSRSVGHRRAGETNAGDAIARGRQALEEYDFDAAVAAFRDALATSRGGPAAARALLVVLVEHLAQDDDALALEPRLSQAALADPEVRSLLGLAAARAGEVARARRWLAGPSSTRAADAWAALAQTSLVRSAFDEVERSLREIEECDPAHPSLLPVRAALATARADARRPDEEALAAILATGDEAAAEARARELLARWPDSAAAARALAAIDARRRRDDAAAALDAATAALERGELGRARELGRRAATLGGDAGDLMVHLDAVEAEARATRDASRVEEVSRGLCEDGLRGLTGYLLLEPALRGRVKVRAPDAALLRWLDVLGPVAEPAAAVEAGCALRAALSASDAGDHETALRLVDEHVSLLGEIREARSLRSRARDALAAKRQHAVEVALETAMIAWSDGDVARAARVVDALDLRALAPEARARADELAAAVGRHRELSERMRRVEAWVSNGQFLDARRELAALLAITAERSTDGAVAVKAPLECDDLAGARGRLDEVRAGLRKAWRVRSTTNEPFDPSRLGEVVGHLPIEHMPEPWASRDGQLVFAVAHEHHVFVAVVEVAHGRMAVHHVETPEPMGYLLARCIDGERLWIASGHDVLQIDWRTGDVLRWESLRGFLGDDRRAEHAFFMPEAATLWLESMGDERSFEVQLIDLDAWRIARTVHAGRYLVPVPGDAPRIAALDFDAGAVLYAGRGQVAGELLEVARQRVAALAPHPTAAGFVVASAPADEDVELVLTELVPGCVRRDHALPNSNPDATIAIAAARERGLLFVYHIGGNGPEVTALRAGENGLATVYRMDAPDDILLAHDPTSGNVFAAWEADGIRVQRLGDDAPPFDTRPSRVPFPSVAPHFLCDPHVGDDMFAPATEAARAGRWDEVREQLEVFSTAELGEPQLEHFHHLYGLALARTGNRMRAREFWEAGRGHEMPDMMFSCKLAACLEIVEDLPDPLPACWWDGNASPVKQLRGSMATAERCRALGDEVGAFAALRRRIVYRTRERQSLARLADLWLRVPEEDAAGWFDKAQALAQFLSAADDRERDLPIPDAWDGVRIAEIAAQARAWFAATRLP